MTETSRPLDIESIGTCPDDKSQIGRVSGCQGCPGQSYCQTMSSGVKTESQDFLETRMKVIKHKIIVMSGKGGVGKSSVAVMLALSLAKKGFKVGLLDADLCGPSVPKILDCENSQIVNQPWGWIPVQRSGIQVMSVGFLLSGNDTPVVWRGPRKTQMLHRFLKDTFWGVLDYLVIDTPPGTSDEHLSVIAAIKEAEPDGCVVVTTPQDLALDVVKKQLNFCKKMKLPVIGVVENMRGFVCPCCGEIYDVFSNGGGEKLCSEFNLSLLGSLPLDPSIAKSGDEGFESLFNNNNNNDNTNSETLKAIQNITTKLSDSLTIK
eukprot:TRINITY_DN7656_c0_g1_i1.p2 TRINITY_DN7656_c0_g1~~TRINITY_DN7656_c0_g1_i1.p2  ORF type:complete len:320 (+),score=69.36 TRINITY_DN7656_c0_g1_i1:1480-2439(+)